MCDALRRLISTIEKATTEKIKKPARVSLPGPKQREPRIRLLIAVAWSVRKSRSSTRARHILPCKTRHFISQEVNKHMDAAATDSCMRTVKTGTAEGSVRPARLGCHRCGRNEDFSLSTLEPTSVMCFDAVPSSRLPPPASRQGAYIDGGPRRVVAAPIWLRSLCPSGLFVCLRPHVPGKLGFPAGSWPVHGPATVPVVRREPKTYAHTARKSQKSYRFAFSGVAA